MGSHTLLLLVAVTALVSTSAESVSELQELSASEADDPFGGLLAVGSFSVSSAFLEKRLGASAGERHTTKADATQRMRSSDNHNTDFVCPPGDDPDDWITMHDVANSNGKVHCVAAPSGSDKNDAGVTFVASGDGTGVAKNGKYKFGQGNNKEYSVFRGTDDLVKDGNVKTVSSMNTLPCTLSAVAQTTGSTVTGEFLHAVVDADRQFKSKRAAFRAVEGTKTCSAVATFLQTGTLSLGVDGTNGNWDDKLWVRVVKLAVCVADSADDTRKCAETKYVTSCMVGTSTQNAVDCNNRASDGSEGMTDEEAMGFAALM